MKAASTAARDAFRAQGLAFTDPSIVWPKEIQADAKILADSDFAAVSSYDSVANASILDAANAVSFAEAVAPGASAQRIRRLLSLSPDTAATCAPPG